MGKNPTYKGRTKWEIAEEAFQRLGPTADQPAVNRYFQTNYDLPGCEASMFWTARAEAKRKAGLKVGARDTYVPPATLNVELVAREAQQASPKLPPSAIVRQLRDLAEAVGGYDQLIELIAVLKGPEEAVVERESSFTTTPQCGER